MHVICLLFEYVAKGCQECAAPEVVFAFPRISFDWKLLTWIGNFLYQKRTGVFKIRLYVAIICLLISRLWANY